MITTLRLRAVGVGVCLVSLLTAVMAWPQSYSHVRIVRLSFVEGTVSIQRPDVPEWASAPVNTPIQEGFKLSTTEDSFAEVQFENASTARLGQLSLLEFMELALSPTGGKQNRLTLHQGYATFSFIPEGDDIYEVKTADATFTPYGKTTFRVDIDEGLLRVTVFKGSVEVSSPYGSGTLAKNTVLELRPGAEQAFQVSQGITKDDWDEWVNQREGAETLLQNKRAPGFYTADVSSLLYGWNDLWSYGNWSYLPAYGYGWAPIAPVGWVPYSFGRWCWYPGFGYTWISAEPWGWLPYHYGEWVFLPNTGWCWIPGNFGAWSPALVVWSQGPGWVGWAPRPGATARAGQNTCPNPRGCATAVSLDTFQSGKPVAPRSILAIDPSQGRIVASPEIQPSRLAMLPGPPRPKAAAESGIAFDAANGRFVNSHPNPAAVRSVSNTSTASPVAGSAATTAVSPANSEASPISEPSGIPEVRPGNPTPARASLHPAPTTPAVVPAPGAASLSNPRAGSAPSAHNSAGSTSSFGHSASTSNPHIRDGSPSHSAPASSSESLSGSRGGGGFSAGGGRGSSTGGGGHSGGGTSSGSHH